MPKEEKNMARTVEESVINAIVGSFVSPKQAQKNKPSKSYMAIGNTIPKVGAHFKCKRLEKEANGDLSFFRTETTTVQEVKKLADNVFVVTTRNSYYITRVVNLPPSNVHFAIIKNEPEIGSDLYCYKLEFKGEESRCVKCKTTEIKKLIRIHGLYKVKTNNSIYVCFLM